MAIKPLQMPDLSQLPDPNKDLFGGMGMTNPTSLMTMSNTQVNDLLNPKAQQDALIKPSAEAAKILQQTQAEQQAQVSELDKLQQQQLRMAEEKRKQEQAEYEANIKQAARLRAEQEKARAEKVKEQGGKIGAGADGSFILTKDLQDLFANKDWNAIISDKERTDQGEVWLKASEAQLRQMGASEEAIKGEIDEARKAITANISAYRDTMNKDGQGAFDLTVAPLAKFGNFLMQAGGLAVKGYGEIADVLGADGVAYALRETGHTLIDKGISGNEAVADYESSAIKLKRANSAYEGRKFDVENPLANWRDGGFAGVVHGGGNAIKRMWDNDLTLNTVAEFIPQLIGTGGAAVAGKQVTARAVANVATAQATRQSVGLATRALASNVSTKYGLVPRATMGAYGTIMGTADAGGGAYEQVLSADFDTLRQHYGEDAWNNAVKHHGSEEEARKALATDASYTAMRGIAPIAAVSSVFGLESAIAGMLSRKAVIDQARKFSIGGFAKGVGSTAIETASEAFEEGATQYYQNVGANPYTGVDLMAGVSDAVGMGAFMGGASAAAVNAVSSFSQSGKPNFTADFNNLMGEFVRTGNFNYEQLTPIVNNHLQNIDGMYDPDGGISLEDTQRLRQRYYDTVIDNVYEAELSDGSKQQVSPLSLMTDEQRANFNKWVQTSFGINTNNYATYRQSKEYDVYTSNDIDAVRQTNNADLLDAFRVRNNVETNQIAPERMAYVTALANMIDNLGSIDQTLNTRQREEAFVKYRADNILTSDILTSDDVMGLTDFAQKFMDANSRRFTNAEQQQHSRVQTAAEQVRQNKGTQNGFSKQEQNSNTQSDGQTTFDENGRPVPSESPTVDRSTVAGEENQTTQLAADERTGAGNGNAQSVGDGATRQDPNASTQGDTTAGSADTTTGVGAVAGQTTNTGDTQATTTPTSTGGQATSAGATGTTSQGGQSVGQAQPSPTQNSVGGGSGGVTPTERNPNDGSNQTTAEVVSVDLSNLAELGVPPVVIPYARKEWVGDGQPLAEVSGQSHLINYNGRAIVVLTVGELSLPFYRSTGDGGKTDVAKDKWYPIFGVGADGWLNKTNSKDINDYYGSPALRQVSELLDATITPEQLAEAERTSKVGTPSTSPDTYAVINQAFPNTPTENGTGNTAKILQENIAFVVNALQGVNITPQTTDQTTTQIDEVAYEKSFIKTAFANLGKLGQGLSQHRHDLRNLLKLPANTDTADMVDGLYGLIHMPQAQLTTLINNSSNRTNIIVRTHKAVQQLRSNVNKLMEKDRAETRKQEERAKREAQRVEEREAGHLTREQEAEAKRQASAERKEQAQLKKERLAEQRRTEREQAKLEADINRADVANEKANQLAIDAEQSATQKEQQLAELTQSLTDKQQELSDAKTRLADAKKQVVTASKDLSTATSEERKAELVYKRETKKSPKAEKKQAWKDAKDLVELTKSNLTKATKEVTLADREVARLTKEANNLKVKVKTATTVRNKANIAAKNARAKANQTQATLDGPRGVETTQPTQTADVEADLQTEQVDTAPPANLPATTSQPQRDKRMRIEMTSTGLPTILMGMESTGLPTIEMGYTIYLDYVPEQHKEEVRQDLIDNIPSEADIIGIITELSDVVGVTYETMLNKLVDNSDNLNQNEYDGLASLLDTILIDLYETTNEQTNPSTNSQSTETVGETQRSEQGTAQQAESNVATTTLPAVLGFRSLEVASRELTPLINTSVADLTLSEFTDLVNTISQATNLPTDVVVANLANSQLLLEQPQGNILDFVYDEINNVWVWASSYTPPQRGQLNATEQNQIGREQTPSREQGNRSLNAPNRAGTPALAEPMQRVQDPIQLGTTDTGLGTIELGTPENTQVLLETSNSKSDYVVQVNPTGGYTITRFGKTKKGSKPLSFTVETSSEVDNHLPKGVSKKLRNEIKSAIDTHAGVLPIQRDLFAQETDNVQTEQNDLGQSDQSTTTRRENEREENAVRNDGVSDEQAGSIRGQSTTNDVSEQERNSQEVTDQTKAYYADRLSGRERKAIAEVATFEGVSPETVYQAIADGNINFFSGRGETSGASADVMARELVAQEIAPDTQSAVGLINRLTTPAETSIKDNTPSGKSEVGQALDQSPQDRRVIDEHLQSERSRLAREIQSELDTTQDVTDKAIELQQEQKSLPKDATEMVEQALADQLANDGKETSSLPQKVKDALGRILAKIRSTVAAVAMTIALATGINIAVPQDAMAATPVETATVQHIVNTGDNQGKPIIVADKQAGTLTLYTSAGIEVNSTSALFGRAKGDLVTQTNTTPSGRYDLSYETNINNNAYGNSAQVLKVNGSFVENNAGNVAIHRVLKGREGRLASETVADNRISYGCINIPASFYDAHFDRSMDAVVYVLPETDVGRTGIFANIPEANVVSDMDNANTGQSVEVTTEQIQKATPVEQLKTAPAQAQAPITIAGTTPSGQVAVVAPTVTGGIMADRVNVPFERHTEAEMMANGVFDTEPVSANIRSSSESGGWNIFELAAALAALTYGGNKIRNRRRNKLESKAKAQQSTGTPTMEDIPISEQNPKNTDRQKQAQEDVDTNHNDVVEANIADNPSPNAKDIPSDFQAPPQKTAFADAVSRALWLDYMQDESRRLGASEDVYNLFDHLDIVASEIDEIMHDKSFQQSQDGQFDDARSWTNSDVSDRGRVGFLPATLNLMGGATPHFDTLMKKLGVARFGHEADSSIPSVVLAQVKAKTEGIKSHIYKVFVKPVERMIDDLATKTGVMNTELEIDVGRLATVNHILNEGADGLWKSKERYIAERQKQLDNTIAIITTLNPSSREYHRHMENSATLRSEINKTQKDLDAGRTMYNGDEQWDGTTPLPGGYTKALAEQTLADLKAKYGNDFDTILKTSKEVSKAVHKIRQFAVAHGVFTNEQIEAFNEIGFVEYVPLYKESKTAEEILGFNEVDNETQSSIMDRLTADLPTRQVKALGLAKDLSQYSRNGATTIAADGMTNLKAFTANMAKRAGQQQFVNTLQQMYEGTVGQPYSRIANMTEEQLAELNTSHDAGRVPGLIRVPASTGVNHYATKALKEKTANIKPLKAKGFNQHGQLVDFHYYFTEPTIQNEVYQNAELNDTMLMKGLNNVASITRTMAGLMTRFKPVWNIYNYARDSMERMSVMLMRPVKDQNGQIVPRWNLAKSYFKNLAILVPHASEIYRAMVLGENKTPLQRILWEAIDSGAVNMMTSITERHNVMSDLKKSQVDKLKEQAANMLGYGLNNVGAGKVRQGANTIADWYIVGLTEIPQISTALASYMAYRDNNVNKRETANRVRDQYDPLRSGNKIVSNMSAAYPFVRSTFSGHYNLHRSLTQYWKPGEWQFTLGYTLGGTIGVIMALSMLAGAMGDDDDGIPRIARIPASTLAQGVPIPIGDNGVWSIPVGFGMNKLLWGVGANLFRQYSGWQDGADTMTAIAGIVMDNSSPVQGSSAKVMEQNPVAGSLLTVVPTLAKPIVEQAFNINSFTGAKIINRETPSDQYDHAQDNFNTPDKYKGLARWFFETSGGSMDVRPETLKHLLDGYGNMMGPLSAVPKVYMQDKGDKSLGNTQTKGEIFGPLWTALGADMAVQPNAMNIASHTYAMQDLRMNLHKHFGVGQTHSKDDYSATADIGPRGGENRKKAWQITQMKLEEVNAPQDVIDYIVNNMKYDTARQTLDSNYKRLAGEYYKLRQSGKDDPEMRQAVQDAYEQLDNLTRQYIKENNRAYYELQQRY